MSGFKTLYKFAKRYGKEIGFQIFFATLWVATTLLIPILMANIIDYGIVENDMDYVVKTGIQMLVVTLFNIITLLISLYFLTRANAGICRDLRRTLYEKILNWSAHTRQKFSTSTLITRNVNDVKQVSLLIDMSLRKIYTTSITIIGAVSIAFSLDSQMALFMVIIVPVILVAGNRLTTRAIPQYAKIRTSIDSINRLFGQNIIGIRVVKAFDKTDYEQNLFSEAVDDAYNASIKAESTMMLLGPLVALAANLLIVALLWVGAGRVNELTLQIGVLVAIIEYVIMALNNVQQLSSIITIVPRSKVSLDRIEEVLSTEEVVVKPTEDQCIRPSTDDYFRGIPLYTEGISINQVTFKYPGASLTALLDINTKIEKGDITAIIGSTGAGKSTLLRLIMRNFDVNEGSIQLAGQDIKHLTDKDYNHLVTLVPHKTFLFSGTVRENILAGRGDATDEEIWDVLDVSQIGEFFRGENGLDTYISQNATNLSGGQKQRISIARGLIRETEFYFFDDCFSALDFTTESRIRKAIIKRLQGRTIVVVAQRVATVQSAGKILVMEDGRITHSGTHDELVEFSSIYNEIVSSQIQVD